MLSSVTIVRACVLLVAAVRALATAEQEALVELGVGAAVQKLCAREVTAVQYAEALLARARNYTCINAYASLDEEKVSSVGSLALSGQYAQDNKMTAM